VSSVPIGLPDKSVAPTIHATKMAMAAEMTRPTMPIQLDVR
jgi:hypothetical protein